MNNEDNIMLINYLTEENEKYIKLNSELTMDNKLLNARFAEYEKTFASLKNENDKYINDLYKETKEKLEFINELRDTQEELKCVKREYEIYREQSKIKYDKLKDLYEKHGLKAKDISYVMEHLENKIAEREKRIKFLDENIIKPKYAKIKAQTELIEKLTCDKQVLINLLNQHNIAIPESVISENI